MSVCRVHKKSSYTVINNKILRSKNLSCAATGLLCKVMSLPDDWDYTVAGLVSICKEGKTAINSMLKELKEWEYLKVTKLMPSQTKSGRIEYVYDFFEESGKDDYYGKGIPNPHKLKRKSSNVESVESVENHVESDVLSDEQDIGKQDIEILCLESLHIENQPQLNTNISNTKKSINKSINQSKISGETDNLNVESVENISDVIRNNIEYDWYINYFANNDDLSDDNETYANSIDDIDMILNIIIGCICSKQSYIFIGKQPIPHDVVKSRLMKINHQHIEYVLKSLMLSTRNIKNPKAYILTALYNAPITCQFMENSELKNLDPAMFIPEKYHDDKFKETHYKHTSFIPSFDG